MLLQVVDVAEADEALLLVTARADGALADTALPMDEPVLPAWSVRCLQVMQI